MANKNDVLDPQDAKTVDPDVFMDMFERSMAAGSEHWAKIKSQGIAEGEEENATYTAIAMALKDDLADDETLFQSVVYRIFALLDYSKRPDLSEWVREVEGGGMDLHPALIYAAAKVKMTRKGLFQEKKFKQTLRDLSKLA